ncbi:MAG: hypothetical protein O3A46_04675 [Candidatus Poribacteria bacterium]|nr:hypothetical protein [Candidatus Poribacteria bacterium]
MTQHRPRRFVNEAFSRQCYRLGVDPRRCDVLDLTRAGIRSATPSVSDEPTRRAEASKDQRRRKRIAVVDFDVPVELIQSGYGGGQVVQVRTAATRLGTVVSEMLISALVEEGNFDVIERTQLEEILKEHDLTQQGLLDPETSVKAGKILGVDLILGGKLTEFGVKQKRKAGLGIATSLLLGVAVDLKKSTARAVVDARVVEAQTGRILVAKQGTGENDESSLAFGGTDLATFIGGVSIESAEWTESRIGRATRDAVHVIVKELVELFPFEATIVAKLPDGTFILDVGKFSGVREDDRFMVVRETVIKDEDSGEIVWTERDELGAIRVIAVQDDRSRCDGAALPGTAVTNPSRIGDAEPGDIAVLVYRVKSDDEESNDNAE